MCVGVTVTTEDTALEKQCYKPPDWENNSLPQSTDWQLVFQENPEKIQTQNKIMAMITMGLLLML